MFEAGKTLLYLNWFVAKIAYTWMLIVFICMYVSAFSEGYILYILQLYTFFLVKNKYPVPIIASIMQFD